MKNTLPSANVSCAPSATPGATRFAVSNSSRRRAGVAIIAAMTLGLGLVSCASDADTDSASAVSMRTGSGSAQSSMSAETSTATETVTMDPDETPSDEFSTDTVEVAPAKASYLGIKDVRIGAHEGHDRLVFEFVGEGRPGYWIRYEDTPMQQGSGNPISVSGQQKLSIDIRGVGYPFDFDMTDFPSSPVKPPNSKQIAEVVGAGTFEGTSQYVVGINGKRAPFQAFVLQNPTRLVIDFQAE